MRVSTGPQHVRAHTHFKVTRSDCVYGYGGDGDDYGCGFFVGDDCGGWWNGY